MGKQNIGQLALFIAYLWIIVFLQVYIIKINLAYPTENNLKFNELRAWESKKLMCQINTLNVTHCNTLK